MKSREFPQFSPIPWLSDPLSGMLGNHTLGRPESYLYIKFGRNPVVNKNFTARGVSKNVIFSTISPIAPLSDPLSGYFDFGKVGRSNLYVRIKFGVNRLKKKI